jgi:glycosyltransferase involved in cell wall biosynthesis
MGCHTQPEHGVAFDSERKRVAILLAVYNGEMFLERQLETLARQSISAIDLWISDDGSGDSTQEIVRRVAKTWVKGKVRLIEGPGLGFAENFRSLLANPEVQADYVAFCDQDDVWDDDKLADALTWLTTQPDDVPALFCSRTRIIAIDGKPAGFSPLFRKEPSFQNALVQSIAGGNTMVMNRAARTVLLDASRRAEFVSHDWWCYLIVTGVGGKVHYSPDTKIGYRQHPGNLVGENNSWRARITRFDNLMRGRFSRWNDQNLAGLVACADLLTPEARETVRLFINARSRALPARIFALLRSGVCRQTVLSSVLLYLACALKKI